MSKQRQLIDSLASARRHAATAVLNRADALPILATCALASFFRPGPAQPCRCWRNQRESEGCGDKRQSGVVLSLRPSCGARDAHILIVGTLVAVPITFASVEALALVGGAVLVYGLACVARPVAEARGLRTLVYGGSAACVPAAPVVFFGLAFRCGLL